MDTVEKKMDILLNEISECREDERDAQEQTLQTIGMGGAIIGVLTGASFTGFEGNYVRWLFVLSASILFVVFGYLITLGVGNTLRYHYLQDLEDQLNELLGDSCDMIPFWKSMSSPVMTRNIKHVKSKYSFISFGAICVAGGAALGFCFLMMVMLFWQMKPWVLTDWICVILFLVGVLACGISFFIICVKSKKMYAYCRENSVKARDLRRAKGWNTLNKAYKREISKESMVQMITYYIYPRLADLQKPLLIIVGYLMGSFLFERWDDGDLAASLKVLFWSWVVVDLMVYQSRLLWNDIRGLPEDMKAKKTNRLPVHILGTRKAVSVAFAVIVVKLLLAGLILRFLIPGELSGMLLILIAVIAVTAVFYEVSSERKWVCGVYLLVSVGYPIRMVTGLLAAKYDLFTVPIISGGYAVPRGILVLLLISYGLFGIFSSLLSWAHQAVLQKKKIGFITKCYYHPLLDQLGDRFAKMEPLKEKGRITDCWNAVFLIALFSLAAIPCWIAIGSGNTATMIRMIPAEVMMIVLAVFICCAGKNRWLLAAALTGVFIVVKALVLRYVIQWSGLYVLICCNQLFAVALYYFLRFMFRPDFDFVMVCRMLLFAVIEFFVGPKTMRIMNKEKNK